MAEQEVRTTRDVVRQSARWLQARLARCGTPSNLPRCRWLRWLEFLLFTLEPGKARDCCIRKYPYEYPNIPRILPGTTEIIGLALLSAC
eukprot:766799-Hanusia_phi.AAC.1